MHLEMGMRKDRTCKNVSTSCESPSKRSKNTENEKSSENSSGASINFLPVEILLEIFSYLSSQDLYSLQRVSTFFEDIVRDPVVWRDYEVTNNSMNTSDVLQELKRMPFLKRIRIEARADSDDILRQLSLTNKNIEELHIINCTGSTAKLYLRSSHLIRILERCNRLHTINILGTRFRGLKFYRLLGSMGLRLRAASAPATSTQFKTFAKHAHHIRAKDRKVISEWCRGVRNWMPLQYSVLEQVGGQACTALVSYLYDDFVSIDASSSCKAST